MTSRSDRIPETMIGNQDLVVPVTHDSAPDAIQDLSNNGDHVHNEDAEPCDMNMSHRATLQRDEAPHAEIPPILSRGKGHRRKTLRTLQASLVWGLSKDWPQRSIAKFSEADRAMEVAPHGSTVEDVLWAIAIAQRLPELRSQLAVEEWARLVKSLCQMTNEANQASVHVDPWIATLACVELGMTLGYGCPEHAECLRAAESSRCAAFEVLSNSCSKEGAPRHLAYSFSIPFFAAWVRTLTLYRELYGDLPRDLQESFEYFVRHLVRQTRPDRTPVFSEQLHPMDRKEWQALWNMARRIVADPTERQLIAHVVDKKGSATARIRKLASHCDEVEGLARLSQGWGKRSVSMFVDFRNRDVAVELRAHGKTLICGRHQPNIHWNGVKLEPTEPWTLQCWYSEPEADYLEVEWQMTHGCRLQRQFLLAKDDEFVFMGDAVLPAKQGRIEYRMDWPCCPEILFQSRDESREGSLIADGKPMAHVIPLALPEWRRQQSKGNLRQEATRPCMELHSEGSALYAPVLFHFRSKDLDRELTWRQLTVAESLQRVDQDVAVGYRYQCGPRQWLFYKSLTKFGNRTVLGQNFSLDFACNRFLRNGMTKTIVDVEMDPDDDGPEPHAVGEKPSERTTTNSSSGNSRWS